MTILELEQGLRNLVASQPSIMQSVNGPVVNSIMGLIDSTKNMMYRVQTYPAQDAFKFSMTAEVQRVEASIISLAVQNLQARGINLMLYIPQDSQFAQFAGAYGTYPSNVDESIFGSQMAYIPNTVPQPTVSTEFDMAESAPTTPKQSKKKTSSDNTIPQATSYGKSEKKIDIVVNKIKSAKRKQETAKANQEAEKVENNSTEAQDSSKEHSPDETQQSESGPKRPSSSAGRDYLIELLKK